MSKRVLVCGGGGFIGSHLVRKLKTEQDVRVTAVDLKKSDYITGYADEFRIRDLRREESVEDLFRNKTYDEVYQLAADMGGVEYINSGQHDPDVMNNSMQINLNISRRYESIGKLFFSSSACVYPYTNQLDPNNPICSEDTAYPANPDTEYGWEKLFCERMYLAYNRNYGLDIRIARFHTIYGEEGSWTGGKEKAPAAICRKIAQTATGVIDLFGDGKQTRTYLYIDDCLDAVLKFMDSPHLGPINIGSEELISIDSLALLIASVSGRQLQIKLNHVDGPTGVRGRRSDNKLVRELLGWEPRTPLIEGMERTYKWIEKQSSMQVRP